MASFIYDFYSYYFRTDLAVSNIKAVHDGTNFTGTETDDLLFTFGRNFITKNKRSVTTLSLLFGLPTHGDFALKHPQFGYAQVGIGGQIDGCYTMNKKIGDFLYGARYIYFAPRNAYDDLGVKHKFTIGNTTDILLAYKNFWNKNGMEFGYTLRFQYGAHVYPDFDDIVKKTEYIRSYYYLVYKYKFKVNNVSNRFLFNISYGFDHRPKVYGNKYLIILWSSWSVSF